MFESSPNLFDHGKSSQAAVIKPFMKRIRERAAGGGLNDDFQEFFLGQLKSCCAMLGEHENRPIWVKDVESYRMKSEIVAFLSLLQCLDLDEDPTQFEREQVSNLYDAVRDFGETRGWDMQTLHLQFIRAMGNHIQNYVTLIVLPRKLDPIDYN